MSRIVTRLLAAVALVAALAGLRAGDAAAVDIQRVVSAGGIEAWLVEEHAIPIISVAVGFEGGAFYDPPGKDGLAHLLSATLDEGAGEVESEAFQAALRNRAIDLSFDANRDAFEGEMRTLTKNRDVAFGLLAAALTEPRFDAGPVERMKRELIAAAARENERAEQKASQLWYRTVYGAPGYGGELSGTPESLAALTPDDLRWLHRGMFTRKAIKIAVVGDIDAVELGPLLDSTFGGLPESSDFAAIGEQTFAAGARLATLAVESPQTVLRFGLEGLERHDPDFITAFVVNHILGGGDFSSRLFEEVREKRGLSYGVFSALFAMSGTGVVLGGAETRADRVAEALDVIRAEIARMGEAGPTAAELDAAKRYLTGAFPLRFDSNAKIARNLVAFQLGDLGIEYINTRNAQIEAVTLADARRVARTLFRPDALVVVAVGSEASLKALAGGG